MTGPECIRLSNKVILFYLEHRNEVDSYATEYHAEVNRLRASGQHAPSVTELRKRLEVRKLAESVDVDRI